jgi:hypothetical protein
MWRAQSAAADAPTKANSCCGGDSEIELGIFVDGGLQGFGSDGGGVAF